MRDVFFPPEFNERPVTSSIGSRSEERKTHLQNSLLKNHPTQQSCVVMVSHSSSQSQSLRSTNTSFVMTHPVATIYINPKSLNICSPDFGLCFILLARTNIQSHLQ